MQLDAMLLGGEGVLVDLASDTRTVRIDGNAKVGVVQLSVDGQADVARDRKLRSWEFGEPAALTGRRLRGRSKGHSV